MDAVVKDLCVNAWTTQGWYTTQPQDHVVIKDRCVNGNLAILVQSTWIAKNKNWIAAGLQNIETLNFVCFDCPSTSMVQSMYEHTLFLRLQHCPGRHWCCSHGPNPPAILIDCTRTIRIVNDCKNLRNHDCDGLAQDFVDCNRIVTDYRPTIGSAIQKIASQSTKSGRNRNSGYIGKRDDCGISGGQKLVIFSQSCSLIA